MRLNVQQLWWHPNGMVTRADIDDDHIRLLNTARRLKDVVVVVLFYGEALVQFTVVKGLQPCAATEAVGTAKMTCTARIR